MMFGWGIWEIAFLAGVVLLIVIVVLSIFWLSDRRGDRS